MMKTESAIVPGVVYGFRVWLLKGLWQEGLLQSCNGTIWNPKNPLTAWCERCGEGCPGLECECGVYALQRPEDILPTWLPSDLSFAAWGMVALWGRIVVHERGWRAQKAYPAALVVVDEKRRRSTAGQLENIYGVPVFVVSQWHRSEDLEGLRYYILKELLLAWNRKHCEELNDGDRKEEQNAVDS